MRSRLPLARESVRYSSREEGTHGRQEQRAAGKPGQEPPTWFPREGVVRPGKQV